MAKCYLAQKCKDIQHMQINKHNMWPINRMKGKSHMIILTNVGGAFDKIQHLFMIKKKNSNKLSIQI
jgi:hypothetical protein